MRVSLPVRAAAVAASATFLLAPAASAHTAPGDNGTIKIHDARTGEELVRNEPHVCTFYLDAFFFDGRQEAAWKIVEQPPTGHDDVTPANGSPLALDTAGHGRTADLTLPDGHYKLEWNFDGEHGKAKHKVFWVECAKEGGSSAGGSTAGTSGGSTGGSDSGTSGGGSGSGGTTGGTAGGGTSGSTSGTPTPSVADTASPGASGSHSDGSLAETGASVIGAGGAAVALLAVGGVLLVRRRGSRQH
jgi:hypothetical protein